MTSNDANSARYRKFIIFGWFVLFVFVATITGLFVFHKSLFPSDSEMPRGLKVIDSSLSNNKKQESRSPEEILAIGRKQLIRGKYSNAEATFRNLINRPQTIRPLTDWIYFNLFLNEVLSHEFQTAQKYLIDEKKLGSLAVSTDSKNAELSDYFVRANQSLTTPTAEQAIFAEPLLQQYKFNQKLNINRYEVFTLFLAGMKNWELGTIDEASKLLQVFIDVDPSTVDPWVLSYIPLAQARMHDYWIYYQVVARLKQLSGLPGTDSTKEGATPEDLANTQDALKDLNTARKSLQSKGKIEDLFNFAAAAYKVKIEELTLALAEQRHSALENQENNLPESGLTKEPQKSNDELIKSSDSHAKVIEKAEVQAADNDKMRWQSARQTARRSIQLYRFAEAAAILDHVEIHNLNFNNARVNLLNWAKRLAEFKFTLIDDINHSSNGYPQQLWSKHQVLFKGGAKLAEENTLGVVSLEHGGDLVVEIPWKDLAPNVVLDMAKYYISHTSDSKEATRKRWLAVYFAQEFGFQKDAQDFANQAALGDPTYRKEFEHIFLKSGTDKNK